MEEFNFCVYNAYARNGVSIALKRMVKPEDRPVILCIGSDAVMGDALSPLIGTLLKENYKYDGYVYGTLKSTVTAKEVNYAEDFIRTFHPGSKIIAVDAAVGRADDIGLIKVTDGGLFPGQGVNKELNKVGDVSVMGIVAEKSIMNYALLNVTRMNLIYKIADTIAGAIHDALAVKYEYPRREQAV